MEKLALNDENPYHPWKTANDTHEYKLCTKIRGLEILFIVFINFMLCKKKECVWGLKICISILQLLIFCISVGKCIIL